MGDAIRQCVQIQDGLVLDVGCGTGILSLFCKKEGKAKRVIGVEASENIGWCARHILEANGYGDRTEGEIVIGKIEEAILPLEDGEKVDAIVSEWMGFALLFETMLNSVLWARDRYLKPGGVMLPCSARIMVAGGSESGLGLDFWQDVYGFNMTHVSHQIKDCMLKEPGVFEVNPACLVTKPALLQEFDLALMNVQDVNFSKEVSLEYLPTTLDIECSCLVLWFEVYFPTTSPQSTAVQLTTSPYHPKTHWRQTVFQLETPLHPHNQCIKMRIGFVEGAYERSLDISVEYTGLDTQGGKVTKARVYSMCVSQT
eukprot:TRINITY_DN22758_c0_g1_i6.p1 TRINITY_DN22758_c0_g1~~TRINITY_DN22758_c0_g1_i6.p1  ORF type:complete len:330 (-),score=51.98 TRINITY_DN22758_c0_g1_i6:918-1856(-)